MKRVFAVVAALGFLRSAFGQPAGKPAPPYLRVHTNFSLVVHASYANTAPLFGPIGERVWAGPDWNPVFLYPQPAADTQGAVFTVRHGTLDAIWVSTLFDLAAHHLQYVYFLPGLLVTVIDVRFRPLDSDATAVDVEYTRTAIATQGNDRVIAMEQIDKRAGAEWQQAIDKYIAQSEFRSRH